MSYVGNPLCTFVSFVVLSLHFINLKDTKLHEGTIYRPSPESLSRPFHPKRLRIPIEMTSPLLNRFVRFCFDHAHAPFESLINCLMWGISSVFTS